MSLHPHLEEEAIAELHDVGLVDGRDFSSVVEKGVAKGILRHPPRALLRYDLQALDHPRHYLMLQPTVLSLCVLSAASKEHLENCIVSHKITCEILANNIFI